MKKLLLISLVVLVTVAVAAGAYAGKRLSFKKYHRRRGLGRRWRNRHMQPYHPC